MVDSINSLRIQPLNTPAKVGTEHALIDDKELKGILFLGVKGDISSILDDKKVDLLV